MTTRARAPSGDGDVEMSTEHDQSRSELAVEESSLLNYLLRLCDPGKFVESKSSSSELEKIAISACCELWDVSTNAEIAEFLNAHSALTVCEKVLSEQHTPRLYEVCCGLLANLLGHADIAGAVPASLSTAVVALLFGSTDPPVLIEVLRTMYAGICAPGAAAAVWWKTMDAQVFERAMYVLAIALDSALQEKACSFILGCLFYAPSSGVEHLLDLGLVDLLCSMVAGGGQQQRRQSEVKGSAKGDGKDAAGSEADDKEAVQVSAEVMELAVRSLEVVTRDRSRLAYLASKHNASLGRVADLAPLLVRLSRDEDSPTGMQESCCYLLANLVAAIGNDVLTIAQYDRVVDCLADLVNSLDSARALILIQAAASLLLTAEPPYSGDRAALNQRLLTCAAEIAQYLQEETLSVTATGSGSSASGGGSGSSSASSSGGSSSGAGAGAGAGGKSGGAGAASFGSPRTESKAAASASSAPSASKSAASSTSLALRTSEALCRALQPSSDKQVQAALLSFRRAVGADARQAR